MNTRAQASTAWFRPPATPPYGAGRPNPAPRQKALPLWGMAALAGCGGLVAALGLGVARWSLQNVVSGGGAIAAFFLLVALGAGAALQAAGFLVLWGVARLGRELTPRPALVALGTLLLGDAGLVALNAELTSMPSFPPFGPVSALLLCLPYPLAFALLVARTHRTRTVTAAVALALGAVVFPVRSGQEHLAAQQWFAHHRGLDRRLVRTVDWPGGEQDPLETGPYGVRSTVFFQDSNIDGLDDAVVQISPVGADPCASLPVIDSSVDDSSGTYGTTQVLRPTSCTPLGTTAWRLTSGAGWSGLAERRDGVLLILSVDTDTRPDDDLLSIASTLHPMDDHALWPHLAAVGGSAWLLL